MSIAETDPSLDRSLLSDLYREYGIAWDRLLAQLCLPADIGIVKTMTLGQAKELAARHAARKTSEGSQASANVFTGMRLMSPHLSCEQQRVSPVLSPSDLSSIEAVRGIPVENDICDVLSNGPLSVDEITQKTGKPVREIVVSLVRLEMQKIIRRRPGNMYETVKPAEQVPVDSAEEATAEAIAGTQANQRLLDNGDNTVTNLKHKTGKPTEQGAADSPGEAAAEATAATQASERFLDNGDNTVTDLKHKLMWIKNPGRLGGQIGANGVPCAIDWITAKGACKQLVYAGYSDWRLPNVSEWGELCDDMRKLDPARCLEGCQGNWYWTRSESSRKPESCYVVHIGDGKDFDVTGAYDSDRWYVRPVRSLNAGCELTKESPSEVQQHFGPHQTNGREESPIERALMYRRLVDQGETPLEIARRINRSDQHVRDYLRLLDRRLEDKRLAIHSRQLSVDRALKLLRKRKLHGRDVDETRARIEGRVRFPANKVLVAIYEGKKPEKMSNKEWRLWLDPGVRKLLRYKLDLVPDELPDGKPPEKTNQAEASEVDQRGLVVPNVELANVTAIHPESAEKPREDEESKKAKDEGVVKAPGCQGAGYRLPLAVEPDGLIREQDMPEPVSEAQGQEPSYLSRLKAAVNDRTFAWVPVKVAPAQKPVPEVQAKGLSDWSWFRGGETAQPVPEGKQPLDCQIPGEAESVPKAQAKEPSDLSWLYGETAQTIPEGKQREPSDLSWVCGQPAGKPVQRMRARLLWLVGGIGLAGVLAYRGLGFVGVLILVFCGIASAVVAMPKDR